ncbi:putative disease resistance protein RGA3 isoform X3 [Papaver somniferum]|uniref:putative disease resistance protein RGA3 isoform X3 n=1 Tax=Papaver somniferum TaxID=3469 RepID=UPI000E70152B|nr:putative disease resistance protein RGA3 isoform X3 [Papaver somniferum]
MDLATIFVSPILQDLIPKLLTYCSDEFNLVWGWGVKDDLRKLAQTLKKIEAVLHDAEKRQGGNDKLVKIWLGELQDVAYDAVDIFDELHIKDLEQKKKTVSKVFPCLPLKPFGFDYKIALKVKDVNEKLDRITKDMERFNFTSQFGSSSTSGSNITVMNEIREETSSHISDSSAVVGRIDEKLEIIKLLNQDDYSVVRITGMGGMGKTTLAQFVYANTSDDTFVVKKWVSMYGKTKPEEIFLDLLEPKPDRRSSLDEIKASLKQKLMVGKSLIVLDDVWTNHGIDIKKLLKDILSMSSLRIKILMTMRSTEPIPPLTGCRYKTYPLQGLVEDDCWSIIKKTAFAHGGAEETEDLINIGRQISIKCGGLPLAAKTLGGLLYSKKNVEDWLFILNSKIWNLPPTDDKIMSILKLSYDHLSPDVKRCFSYCSIFPKGHVFSKNEVIRMWMAEGFLISPWQANESPEIVGNGYFKILLLNSFFQDERRNIWGDIKSFRMHDLVHDLSVSITGCESLNITIDDIPKIDQSFTFRRLGLQVLHSGVSTAIPSEIYKAFKKLHTFVYSGLHDGEDVWARRVCTFGFIRVLKLSHTGIEELPKSICKLKHLRYLDVKRCNRLKELPQDIRKLIGLEYLIFRNKYTLSAKMPRKVSRLSALKKLSVFIVGEEGKGSGIEELKDLNLLGGKLSIEDLGNVTDGTQANLMGKKNIRHLELSWDSRGCNDPDRIIKDVEVINDLQPHLNLKKLGVSHFGGSEIPTWLRSASVHLPKLVSITLYRCNECEHFPALGGLQHLKYLFMDGFGGVKRIGNEFCPSNEEAVSFPSLVLLYIYHYTNSVNSDRSSRASTFSWSEDLENQNGSTLSTTPTEFPFLRKLYFHIERQVDANLKSLSPKLLWGVLQTLLVAGCNEFVGFEQQHRHQLDHLSYSHLRRLEVFKCPSLTVLPADFSGLNSLTYLAIEECSSLHSLPDGIQYLPALETLIIGGFSEDLTSFPFPAASGSDGEKYFVSLRVLKICGWPTLSAELPDQLQLLTCLQCFTIRGFPCLSSLPEWFRELSSLQNLYFLNCSRLQYLPSDEQMQRLTSLKTIYIWNCPLLLERCSGNEEGHKIARRKQVIGSSPSLLDHIPRDADMNLELLARRTSGIFSNQNKEKRWIDSCGRKCFMFFPTSFYIAWGDDTRYWTWLSITEPSAASNNAEIEVSELINVCWFGVHGKLDMSKLTPGVNYEVVFIVMLRERSSGWDAPVNLCLVLPDAQRLVKEVVLETMPKSQWIEIHVGDFKTPEQPGDQEKQVDFRLSGQDTVTWKSGLFIEGAIVRPKRHKFAHLKQVNGHVHDLAVSTAGSESRMLKIPTGVVPEVSTAGSESRMLKIPTGVVPEDMNLELLARMTSGIFSNQNKEKRWIDSRGRKCFMFFPRSFYIAWGDDTRYWTWLSVTEPSAASNNAEIEVPELIKVCWLDVHGTLDMSKLTPGVNYEVVFIVMLRERSYGWGKPVNLCLVLPDGQRLDQTLVLETMPKSTWIEIHVGDFQTPEQQPGDQEKQVKFNLSEQETLFWKSGLVIEGAIVRPKKSSS